MDPTLPYLYVKIGPWYLWWLCQIITIFVYVVFQETLALTKLWHRVSSKSINYLLHTSMVWKMDFSFQFHTHITHDNNSSAINILCQSIRELFASDHLHLYRNTSSNYMQKHAFQDQYIKYILFSFFQDHFLVQS